MVAEFKSHILSRDEKGFLGVPFKRLMLSGIAGGVVYMAARFALPDVALVLAGGVVLFVVILTAPQGGIPRWQRLLYRLRGSLMLAAAQRPQSPLASLARSLELPSDLARLHGDVLFVAQTPLTDVDLAEWVSYADVREADRDDGLMLLAGMEAG